MIINGYIKQGFLIPTKKTLKDGSENSESDGETQEEVQTEE